MTESVEEIKGFTVVPVTLPASKFLKQKEIKHYLYIKKHQSSADKELAERSLFLVNPPLNASLNTIKSFIKHVSPSSLVSNLFINTENLDYEINLTKLTSDLYDEDRDETLKLPNGTALIVFIDKAAANLAMTKLKKYAKSKRDQYVWTFNEDKSASIKFQESYKKDILPIEKASEAVSQAMVEFEQREAASIQNLKDLKSVVDDDGFTLVVGKNRKTKRGILGKISSTTNSTNTEEYHKKNKKKEKEDFYRFQIRERKKLEMNELLKKFREDQERVKDLKEKKRFRPY